MITGFDLKSVQKKGMQLKQTLLRQLFEVQIQIKLWTTFHRKSLVGPKS
jgi:hypothetical protein